VPPAENLAYSTFLSDFIEVNVDMWKGNNALIPDPDAQIKDIESKPYHWPLLIRGLRMNSWDNHNYKYFLLGNPLIWWATFLAIILLPLLILSTKIRISRGLTYVPRGFSIFKIGEWNDFMFASFIGLGGWCLHFIPFFIMGRVTYLHHYFPALYFGMITFVCFLDRLLYRFSVRVHNASLFVVALVFISTFIFFKDFSFGMYGSASEWANRKWLSSWNIYSPVHS
jgi:dolichyl-phosphate-mannose-protein mannosyltransferase